MVLLDGRTWLEHLSLEHCWHNLAQCSVGRIGVLVDSAPEIYPVNHVVDERTIVFRTDPGSKLRGIDRSPVVCFEVDEVSGQDHTGWSVLVKGRAVEVTDPEELARLVELPLEYWAVGDKQRWIRVRPIEVTGRAIHRPD